MAVAGRGIERSAALRPPFTVLSANQFWKALVGSLQHVEHDCCLRIAAKIGSPGLLEGFLHDSESRWA